jgi:hypothetical protein
MSQRIVNDQNFPSFLFATPLNRSSIVNGLVREAIWEPLAFVVVMVLTLFRRDVQRD